MSYYDRMFQELTGRRAGYQEALAQAHLAQQQIAQQQLSAQLLRTYGEAYQNQAPRKPCRLSECGKPAALEAEREGYCDGHWENLQYNLRASRRAT